MDRRRGAAGDGMVRPQYLLAIRQRDRVVRCTTIVLTGKRGMICRMPVLGCKSAGKSSQQLVDDRQNLVPARDRQLTARHKRRLYIDQAKNVASCVDSHASPR